MLIHKQLHIGQNLLSICHQYSCFHLVSSQIVDYDDELLLLCSLELRKYLGLHVTCEEEPLNNTEYMVF